ncbi:helix-turn-helix transcriptional regulator [Streptomyces sp. BE147]|uniref:helix-turn-helix domain-containing protein n=1 Tax=unclassified Streptomyces TaxID=2593676 RepID=UPI002E7A3C94|nr:helix-turn-helix transcriptional regulator [Streptomyces sp. BE147]MEE1741835.1 helix-turn-helix transcriptional regulator [Streptomyces sp. BE147]
MSTQATNQARVIPLRPVPATPPATAAPAAPAPREPLWRDIVGEVLRRERLAQERTLKDVADAARISMPYLSEVERGRKEASSEVLAAAAHALGLGLADLLGLARGELIRLTSVRPPATRPVRVAAPSRAPMGEVRLAA